MNVREYIYDTLSRIMLDGAYASLTMRSSMNDLSPADTALASEIIYGTLRNYDFLEFQWADLVQRKPKKKLCVLLNMSIYQLQYLERIPNYAVIDEAVKLCGKSDKGFINALLHKVDDRGQIKPQETDPIKQTALMYSHPLWILKMWEKHYGYEKMMQIAAFNQTRSQVYGRVNTLKVVPAQMKRNKDVSFVNAYSFLYNGNLTDTAWFRNGQVVIQDKSSAMIPLYLKVEKGMKVLDLCSAPGTKTQEIAMLMENTGEVAACDLYPERLRLVEQLMEKTGVSIVRTYAGDSTRKHPQLDEGVFDRVLIDAPCSGLGDLRHKPEIRFHLKPENIDELVKTQKAILAQGAKYLKEGGLMVYSTCTLNRKENENQVQQFLREHPEFTLEEEHTFFPDESDSDGFYFARLKKEPLMVE